MVCSTQARLLKEDEALQVWSYRGLGPPTEVAGAEEDGLLACRRCVLGEGLCHQVKELQEEVITVQHQRLQKEMDQIFSETLQLQEPKPTTTLKETQAESVIIGLENSLLRYGRAGSL